MKPKEIKRTASALQILWSDGSTELVDFGKLRKACSCAVCRELKTPLQETQPYYKRAVQMNKMDLIGNYALGVTWGDGHHSIFSFERIKAAA